MGGIASWFSFESSKDKKKREKAYARKMFPLGEEQQKWERDILAKLFPKKKDIKPLQYELLVLREKILNSDNPDPDDEDEYISRIEIIDNWKKSKTVTLIDDEDKKSILALTLLEVDSRSFEELPSIDDIIKYTENL